MNLKARLAQSQRPEIAQQGPGSHPYVTVKHKTNLRISPMRFAAP